MLDFKLLKGEF
uniref:Uncharacterized protein n=1 Tax=Rhizophora mucronata TaxID=61149 RepID=A0A2P2R4Q4_RHIMU